MDESGVQGHGRGIVGYIRGAGRWNFPVETAAASSLVLWKSFRKLKAYNYFSAILTIVQGI